MRAIRLLLVLIGVVGVVCLGGCKPKKKPVLGQVVMTHTFGKQLFELARNPSFHTYVEIGTWNGRGSTLCLMNGLGARVDGPMLYSLEASQPMLQQAQAFWSAQHPYPVSDRLKLIYGRIIEPDEMISKTALESLFAVNPQMEIFYDQDLVTLEHCPNVIQELPHKIDVLVLDGGEFSSYAEYVRLKPRTQVICCDDMLHLKCHKIVQELMEDPEWKVVSKIEKERHGTAIFCRQEAYEGLVAQLKGCKLFDK